MNSPNLYLLPATNQGLGHVMRSRTIGQSWNAMFGGLTYRGVVDPAHVATGVVVFDNYLATQDDFDYWGKFGHTVVAYTDFNSPVNADIVVNQNIGARVNSSGKNLLGPLYFALREEYFGLKIDVAGGVFDADAQDRKLDPLEFAQRMALASCVITSAGTTAYEALYLGKPLILRLKTDNQELTYNGLINGGYALPDTDKNVSRAYDNWLPELRDGRYLVDGLGARRVCRAIFQIWRRNNG